MVKEYADKQTTIDSFKKLKKEITILMIITIIEALCIAIIVLGKYQ